MKRRGFLSMLGAAAVVPALPAAAAPAVTATYNRYMFGLAVFHARTRAHVSAAGIAYRLKVTTAQAEAMMAEMVGKGMVTPVTGNPGTMRAVSNILKPGVWDVSEVQKSAKVRNDLQQKAQTKAGADTDAKDWLAHLQKICVGEGLDLHSRCFA